MKKPSAITMLYSNLQYSEIPEKKIPDLIKKSYGTVFDLIAKRKKTKILLGMTGRSMEILKDTNPVIFQKLKNLVKDKKIYIVGGTYTNPILPLLPEENRLRQIKKHQELVRKLLNTKPIGFCPPEFAWDPTLSLTLEKCGFQWTIIPQHLIYFSKTLNEAAIFKPSRKTYSAELGAKLLSNSWYRKIMYFPYLIWLFYKELAELDHRPFNILGTSDKIIGIPNNRTWSGFINMAMKEVYLQNQNKLKKYLNNQIKNSQGFFIPYLSDIENIEYGGNSPVVITAKEYGKFLDYFESAGFKIETPDEYLKREKPNLEIYVKSGSGEPAGSFDMWTREPDNIVLDKICQEVREKLKEKKGTKNRKEIEKYLMLAENADGRAWNPLPERRLACFQAAEKALELLK